MSNKGNATTARHMRQRRYRPCPSCSKHYRRCLPTGKNLQVNPVRIEYQKELGYRACCLLCGYATRWLRTRRGAFLEWQRTEHRIYR